MSRTLFRFRFAWMAVFAIFCLIVTAVLIYRDRTVIRGIVLADGTPIAGALVRVPGSTAYVLTDEQGEFALPVVYSGSGTHITASAQGYANTGTIAQPPTSVTLTLSPLPAADNPDYSFISPVLDRTDEFACVRCHASRSASTPGVLPVDEWQQDVHAQSAVNPRFLSLYNGTSIDGTRGQPTVYTFDSAAGVDVPVAPSLGQDSVGPGFRLDFPDSTGTCASCHVPVLALEQGAAGADPNLASGTAAEGVTCDFCHKISGVRMGSDGLPLPDLPGVQSLDFLRPAEDEQIFVGPFDDVAGDDAYLPLQTQSQFCAACHTGSFWGVSMYNSFGEWLDSPYSDPVSGMTCQDCHMPRRGTSTFVDLPPDVTSFVPTRDPATIYSHLMPGAADTQLLQHAAAVDVQTVREAGQISVTVSVTNTGTGHHLPTDNPLRNMILLVEARDADDQPLTLIGGPTIPEWGGVGDPAQGNYAGLPGVLYAKILADFYTGEIPTFAYWRQTRLVSDNRIPALATDTSVYTFRLPDGAGEITVTTRLILRRAFINLMVEKGWDTPDMLMNQQTRVIQ